MKDSNPATSWPFVALTVSIAGISNSPPKISTLEPAAATNNARLGTDPIRALLVLHEEIGIGIAERTGLIGAALRLLVLSAPLMLILVGFATAALGFLVIGVWVLYRVLRGWLALRDGRIVPR